MRGLALLLALTAPALAVASAPVERRESVDEALARAEREARQAEANVRTFEAQQRRARGEAARLAAERRTAAADITLAEARLTAADAALRRALAAVALAEQRLARRRAPLAALLAGLATMSRRPPILALADDSSVAEVVRVRSLIDSTMPLIAARSAALQAELGAGRRLAAQTEAARRQSAGRRAELADRIARFAQLEQRALARAAAIGAEAFAEQDVLVAGDESLLDLQGEAEAAAAARRSARALAALPLATPRPFAPESARVPPRLEYRLPTAARVVEGLGEVDSAGVRSRGIRFATRRGEAIVAPAAGRILFAGPYREHDGIVVIDHGGGWTSLLIAVAPALERGARVSAGAPLGRALGDVRLELRERGVPRSAALIAGSSRILSNRGRTG